ncbi:MAG: Calx-beta domain-containing protein [Planctomycetota bacterium]|jgi:hypothetical protein
MCKRLAYLICLVVLLGLVSPAEAKVLLECDCGICGIGWLQPGWISIPTCGYYENVGGSAVDVNVATGGNDCGCRGYFGEEYPCDPPCDCEPCPGPSCCCPAVGPLAGVEQDFLMNDDCGPDSPCGDAILTFSDLDEGAPYTLKSYHNRLDEETIYVSGVTVTGATDVTAPSTIAQSHEMFVTDTPGLVTFTAGPADVTVRYLHPTENCGSKGCQVFLNGFILEGGRTEVEFELASSGALESVSPANLWVNLSDPAEGTINVYYQVTGGTATKNVDYTIPPGPLVFNEGEISKAIAVSIQFDGTPEQDETIEVTLTSVTGTNVVLGEITKHTYTIIDPRPAVGFDVPTSMAQETDPPLEITVSLSEPAAGEVSVNYAATGGTAANGSDYYLTAGTLNFLPGQTTKPITITFIDDGTEEGAETIVVTLSDANGAKWGITQHTCTLFDPWAGVSFKKLKVDMVCPMKPDTAKEGWTPWEPLDGCNRQPQYGTGISNIAGTWIDAYLCPVGDTGNGNLRVSAYGEPISNTFYARYTGSTEGESIELTLSGSGLKAGEYWLYSYHNAVGLGSISSITATGDGVIQKEDVNNIPIQEVLIDYDLVPSLVRFRTDASGPVTITYHAEPNSNAALNAFKLRTTIRPTIASNPSPFDGELNVDPATTLAWERGKYASSHHVYLGTDFNDVNDADTSSGVYQDNTTETSYDPAGLLEFGTAYYWRIDEVGFNTWKGEVWSFITDSGKARNPVPKDEGRALADQTVLNWTAAPYHANWHDVYFGTDFNDVNDATTTDTRDVYMGRKNLEETSFEPGPLEVDVTYFWRIDELGDATFPKGDVWSFSTAGRIHLKVDFALPLCDANSYSEHWPESAKPGWEIWAQPRWHDMYGHDAVLNDGSGLDRSLGDDFNGPGVGGTGIMAGITTVYEGRAGLIMSGPEMCNLNGSCDCPTVSGTPLYEPICNTWFDITDYPGLPGSIVLLMFYNIPPGEYALYSYHNRYGGERNDNRPHWECVCNPQLPMTSIEARAVAGAENLWGSGYDYGKISGGGKYPLGSPDGVQLLKGAYNVPIQQVTSDDELIPSVISFRTDGSAVMVMYHGTCCVPDDIRPARGSARAVLNAFRLLLLSEAMVASTPRPGDGATDVSPDALLYWQPGPSTAYHDVYLGTNFNDVNNADTSSGLYKGPTLDPNYDPPGFLEYGQTCYWRVDEVNEAVSPGYWKGPVWSFTVHDGKASNPSPADSATEVALDAQLTWSPGVLATSHDVYFGTRFDDVKNATTASAEFKGNQSVGNETYDPPDLLVYGRTYYWRIDEKNPVQDKKGDVWSFTAQSYIVVDDMESYGQTTNQIWWTWEDGTVHFNGAIVWLAVDPCEPVRTGQKAMAYSYDNTGWLPWLELYSEIMADTANLKAGTDWSTLGIKQLRLWFYGDPENDVNETEQMYLGLDDRDVPSTYTEVRYSQMSDLKVPEWREWNIELEDFNTAGVNLQDVNKMYIGFGNSAAPVLGGSGTAYFDDIRLFIPLEFDCFPGSYATYNDWLAYGKPGCWCAAPDGSGYQCVGDADGATSGFPYNYRVFTGDLNMLIACWKLKMGDAGLDPCADMDHKSSGFPYNYRVFTGDLNILIANWKKKDADFGIPGPCPMPE